MDREQELLEKIRQLELRLNKVEKSDEAKDQKIAWLSELVKSLQVLLFGPKSEKLTKEDLIYMSLFNEAEDGAFQQKLNPVHDDQTTEVQSFKRKKRGLSIITNLPDDFPSREIVYNLKGDECHCGCGARLKHIGYVITKRLEIKPAEFTVLIEKREKGACPDCDGIDLNEDDSPAIRIAKGKKHLIPGGIATSGLIAWSLTEKFEFAIPFYRQEKRFQYIGVNLSRANLCNWAVKAGEACSPLIALLEKQIKSGPVINADETPFQVLKEEGREAQKKSWMWLFKGGPPKKPAVLFQYDSRRSSAVPKEFLTDYEGWLQTDDYGAYHTALKSLNKGRPEDKKIHHTLCWAHARRRFEKAWRVTKSHDAKIALDFIREIFKMENLRENLSEQKFMNKRKESCESIFNDFSKWLEDKYPLVLPKSLLGIAMKYTISNWEQLINYAEHQELTPSNNGAENAIRPFVIGRKNFLFSVSTKGADSSAAIYSLIETAKLYNFVPYQYLQYILEKLPYAKNDRDFEKLLPWKLTAEQIFPK